MLTLHLRLCCPLRCRYELFETAHVAEFADDVLRSKTFGGASVTIPHKQSIIPYLDRISDAAQKVRRVCDTPWWNVWLEATRRVREPKSNRVCAHVRARADWSCEHNHCGGRGRVLL